MDFKDPKALLSLLVIGLVYAVLQEFVGPIIGGLVSGALVWIVWIIYFAVVYFVATYIYSAIGGK